MNRVLICKVSSSCGCGCLCLWLLGWWSIKNNTSKEYKDAFLTIIPDPAARKQEEEESESELERVAKEEGKKEATKKIGGGMIS